jgi:AraC-like DNA-binding protein
MGVRATAVASGRSFAEAPSYASAATATRIVDVGLERDDPLESASASIQSIRLILAGAASHGQDSVAVATRYGIDAAQLADADARVPARVAIRMWDEIPRLVGDELFGLRLGEIANPGALPLFAYLMRSSPTLGDGLQVALRYQRILQTLNRTTLVVDDALARLVVEVRPRHVEPLRHAITFAMAYCVSMARSLTATPVTPRAVHLAHAPPEDAEARAAYRRVFGVDVRFGEPPTEVHFERALLAHPIPRAESGLGELLERHAAALLARVPDGPSLAARVRAALVDRLRSGDVDIDPVAATLRMSARTLQRRLRDESTSYSAIVDDVRRELALRYVADPALSLTGIALLLGFADQTTFHRAFVRWTGRAPGAYRRDGTRQTGS